MKIQQHCVRELSEEREECLSPYAVKSRLSRGRCKPEPPCDIRTAFQRDRDRIIHSKAFRRLKHKTQVFIAPMGDHFVTRLTHTLEVAQIARTIARALNVNEDLTEAIALGHDLGHTPFGHVGEDALDELFPRGFKHNEQSLRVVDVIEKDGQGLNLTYEVREGILTHSKSRSAVLGDGWVKSGSYEAEIVKLSDIIAYINHDTGDAIRAGIICEDDLPIEVTRALGHSSSERINTLVTDIIKHSWAVRGENNGKKKPSICLSRRILDAANTLRDFLFEKVYTVNSAEAESERARITVRFLYNYLKERPERLPPEYLTFSNDPEQGVVDYIAGMTDQFALRLAAELGCKA